MRDRLLNAAALVAVCLVTGALLAHGWLAVSTGMYVDFVTGEWLGLAKDLASGVLYRPLVSDAGYGGTRYFPVFFSSIAGLMRLGLDPLVSGFAVSLLGGLLLVLGMGALLARLGLRGPLLWAFALFTVTPRFVQQTMFAIKSDLLAAGLVVWGLESTLASRDSGGWKRLALAALCFVLAFATKVTSLYAAGVAVLWLVIAGHWRKALHLAALLAAGMALVVVLTQVASGGRALESIRACALAGVGPIEWLKEVAAFREKAIGPSNVFTIVLGLASVAWLIGLRRDWKDLPTTLLPCTLVATALVLASPGTSYTNQLVDLLAACLLVLATFAARRPAMLAPMAVLMLLLAVVAARQDIRPVLSAADRSAAYAFRDERRQLVAAFGRFPWPVLSESPELPVLAGQRPYLSDAFAIHVLSVNRPAVAERLLRQVEARSFSAIVLMFDPMSARGRGWYTNVDFGWPIVERMLANYEYQTTLARVRVYVPRTRSAQSSP